MRRFQTVYIFLPSRPPGLKSLSDTVTVAIVSISGRKAGRGISQKKLGPREKLRLSPSTRGWVRTTP